MFKNGLALVTFLTIVLAALLLMSAGAFGAGKTVYVGGSFALTGAYAEDVGAMLAAYEDLSATPLTYGPGKVEGVDAVRVDQIQKGKIAKVGVYPLRNLYSR